MFIGGVVLSLILRPWNIAFQLDMEIFFAMCGLIVLGTVVAFYLFMTGVNLIGPVNASLVNTFEPLSAILFSVLLLNLRLKLIDFIGFFFVISTVFILRLQVRKDHRK